MTVVAEDVETEGWRELLAELECDVIQELSLCSRAIADLWIDNVSTTIICLSGFILPRAAARHTGAARDFGSR